jgi:hypothetical protein
VPPRKKKMNVLKEAEAQIKAELIVTIPKIMDRLSKSNLTEWIYIGLAYQGYSTIGKQTKNDMLGVLWGPVALKLATTPTMGDSGVSVNIFGARFPVNSQVAGLMMLSALGFASMPWDEISAEMHEDIKQFEDVGTCYSNALAKSLTQEERTQLNSLYYAVINAMLGPRDDYLEAVDTFLSFCNNLINKYGGV